MAEFLPCEICGASAWLAVYRGPVRDGNFGRLTEEAQVARCGKCLVNRLEERFCLNERAYETTEYRRSLAQPTEADRFVRVTDALHLEKLNLAWPLEVRDKTIVDVGAAAGSFLDHYAGVAKTCIAIEPAQHFHGRLRSKGYSVYNFADDALAEHRGSADVVFCFSVIEHVEHPGNFLKSLNALLRPSGWLIVTTPNRDDALMALLPDDYPRFFYRRAHRWYFDAASLSKATIAAGFEIERVTFFQRFGLSNAMGWLRDRRPPGNVSLPFAGHAAVSEAWRGLLAEQKASDYLSMVAAKPQLET